MDKSVEQRATRAASCHAGVGPDDLDDGRGIPLGPVDSSNCADCGSESIIYAPDGHLRRLVEIEVDIIRLAIAHYEGRMSEVARRLGIGRSTLYRKISDFQIDTGV